MDSSRAGVTDGVQINHSGALSNLQLANATRGDKNKPAVTSAARGASEARRAELPSNRPLVPLEWLATHWVPSITSLESVHAWFAAKWRGLDALLRALVGVADRTAAFGTLAVYLGVYHLSTGDCRELERAARLPLSS